VCRNGEVPDQVGRQLLHQIGKPSPLLNSKPEPPLQNCCLLTALQVISEERVEGVGLLDAGGQAVPVTRVALGTFSRKAGQPGFRY
jgi:hypothetical protein